MSLPEPYATRSIRARRPRRELLALPQGLDLDAYLADRLSGEIGE